MIPRAQQTPSPLKRCDDIRMEASDNGTHRLKINSSEKKLITAACGLTLLAGLNNGWFGPLIPVVASAQNLPFTYASVLVSYCYSASMLAMCLGKLLIEKFGLKASSAVSAVMMGIGLGVVAFAYGEIPLAIGGTILGFGAGLNSITGTTCVLRYDTADSASSLNRLNFFFGAGSLVGPLIAWAGTQTQWSYHGVYTLGASFAALIALFLFSIQVESKGDNEADTEDVPPKALNWKRPSLWVYSLINFIYVGLESAIATYLFIYMTKALNIESSIASVGMSVVWGGLTAGRLAGMFLCKKYSTMKVTSLAMLLSMSGLAALSLLPLPTFIVITIIGLIGLGYGPIFPNIVATVSNRFPATPAAVSFVIIAGALGGISFPQALGHLLTTIGMRHGMTMLPGAALIMLLMFFFIERTGSTSEDNSPDKDPPENDPSGSSDSRRASSEPTARPRT